ncbi:MAG: TlpA family protein disulfide reductase [Odoribacter sp.]|nr:TlpA family protein disulfide reductase [Odoribacter sp.]
MTIFSLSSCINDKDEDDTINYVKVNDAVPAFTVPDANGDLFNSSEFKGKTSLLMFFLSTCRDCQKVMPRLNEVWNELKEHPDFLMVTISRQETVESVTAYFNENGFTMPVYFDSDRFVFNLFANQTVPRMYVVNENGVVSWMSVEDTEITTQEIINALNLSGTY